ncbi:hypothetical protein [Streptomyces sp. NPDC001250]|uniref:hypothetical protein n=1 Tax=unclassified Streptomyces TaxID=2593676 RepID=UPI003320EF6F
MAAFCKRHAYRGGKPASALLARLRSAPVAPVSLPADVLTALITAQVQLLRSLQTTIKVRLARHPRAILLAGGLKEALGLRSVAAVPWARHGAGHTCAFAPAGRLAGRSVLQDRGS